MTTLSDIMDNKEGSLEEKGKSGAWWKPVALLGVIVTLFALAYVFGVGEKIGALRDWIQGLGPLGPVVFIALYVVAVVAVMPASALTIGAGALFQSFWGVVIVSIASTTGAALAFLVGRYVARDTVAEWLGKNEKFATLDEMTEKHGAVMVAITRLVPLFPFNLLNYGFGLTRVKFWTYVFWSWLCMLPGTILYVVGTDAVTSGIEKGEVPWALIGIVAGVAVLLALLVRFARNKIK